MPTIAIAAASPPNSRQNDALASATISSTAALFCRSEDIIWLNCCLAVAKSMRPSATAQLSSLSRVIILKLVGVCRTADRWVASSSLPRLLTAICRWRGIMVISAAMPKACAMRFMFFSTLMQVEPLPRSHAPYCDRKRPSSSGEGAAASEIIVVIGCIIFLQRVAGNKEFFAFGSYFKNACAVFVVLTVVWHKARYEEKENESDGAAPDD